jgi:hypothetical protein
MTTHRLTRRGFLGLTLSLLRSPGWASDRGTLRQAFAYELRLDVLFGLITLTLRGQAVEEVDRSAGRYRVTIAGEGSGASVTSERRGIIRDGRFLPLEGRTSNTFRRRESWLAIEYDHDRRFVDYHSVSYTLVLGRKLEVHDRVPMPPDRPVDDFVTTVLNFRTGMLERTGAETFRTFVVRRARHEREGPEDVSSAPYRAEIVPLSFTASPDGGSGRHVALVDISAHSPWARAGEPARVTFNPDRRLESIQAPLALGSSLDVQVRVVASPPG